MRLPRTLLFLLLGVGSLRAQVGPFDPTTWPTTIDKTKTVHFKVVDDTIEAPADAPNWSNTMRVLAGGDQDTATVSLAGLNGLRATQGHLNFADSDWSVWADEPVIDVLLQVYGDAAILSAAGQPRNFEFLTGVLPSYVGRVGGQAPVDAKNFQWNWFLLRINNDDRGDGTRYVGTLPENPQGDFSSGGINGGTIRLQAANGITVRAVAMGQEGAFGTLDAVNVFAPPVACEAEPETNRVFLDVNHDTALSDHLIPLDGGDQPVDLEDNIGPANDKRRALRPAGEGVYMNFGITDNYLGLACNDPHAIKVCVEYYDDPEKAGAIFGPEAYATDAISGVAFVDGAKRQTLEGTGTWKRRSWIVNGVNLRGINAGAYTAGPRLHFTRPVHISRIDMALLRTGAHPLAGQDPLANCLSDPDVCTGKYGNYVEMDLANGILNGLTPGTSGGDQEMLQALAGPEGGDQRNAIRPAGNDGNPGFAHMYMNLSIKDPLDPSILPLGPTSQPGARLAIAVTYFDDPALVGKSFRPEVWFTEDTFGTETLAFSPGSLSTVLQGSNKWVESYVELDGVKFKGVNEGPQAAARFHFTDKIFVSRVRYAVIPSCGAKAGLNLLADVKPPITVTRTGDMLRFEWKADVNWKLQYLDPKAENTWLPVTDAAPVLDENFINVLEMAAPESTSRFYRLVKQ